MSYKNISLSTEVYDLLKSMKKEGESFSEFLSRSFKHKSKISDVIGIFTKEEGEQIRRGVEDVKKRAKVRAWHT